MFIKSITGCSISMYVVYWVGGGVWVEPGVSHTLAQAPVQPLTG